VNSSKTELHFSILLALFANSTPDIQLRDCQK